VLWDADPLGRRGGHDVADGDGVAHVETGTARIDDSLLCGLRDERGTHVVRLGLLVVEVEGVSFVEVVPLRVRREPGPTSAGDTGVEDS